MRAWGRGRQEGCDYTPVPLTEQAKERRGIPLNVSVLRMEMSGKFFPVYLTTENFDFVSGARNPTLHMSRSVSSNRPFDFCDPNKIPKAMTQGFHNLFCIPLPVHEALEEAATHVAQVTKKYSLDLPDPLGGVTLSYEQAGHRVPVDASCGITSLFHYVEKGICAQKAHLLAVLLGGSFSKLPEGHVLNGASVRLIRKDINSSYAPGYKGAHAVVGVFLRNGTAYLVDPTVGFYDTSGNYKDLEEFPEESRENACIELNEEGRTLIETKYRGRFFANRIEAVKSRVFSGGAAQGAGGSSYARMPVGFVAPGLGGVGRRPRPHGKGRARESLDVSYCEYVKGHAPNDLVIVRKHFRLSKEPIQRARYPVDRVDDPHTSTNLEESSRINFPYSRFQPYVDAPTKGAPFVVDTFPSSEVEGLYSTTSKRLARLVDFYLCCPGSDKRYNHVVTFCGAFYQPDVSKISIVTENAGISLWKLIQQLKSRGEGFSLDRDGPVLASILHGSLRALEQMNSKGVVHRGLDPEAIYLGPDGTVKVGFTWRSDGVGTTTVPRSPFPLDLFKSPEMLLRDIDRNATIGRNTDVWSLAVTLLCAAGMHPFRETEEIDLNDSGAVSSIIDSVSAPNSKPSLEQIRNHDMKNAFKKMLAPREDRPRAEQLLNGYVKRGRGGETVRVPSDPFVLSWSVAGLDGKRVQNKAVVKNWLQEHNVEMTAVSDEAAAGSSRGGPGMSSRP